ARPRPSHPICGSACALCPRRGGSCSRRSSHRSSSSSARPCPSGHSWRAAAPIPPASCRRPDPLAGIGEIEHIVQLLTVVHGRVRRIPFADQLVRLVHAEVVLVAVEALVVLLRPARVLVLLCILGRLLLPSLRRLAGPDRLVLLLAVTLLGHRYNCGVNDLSAARNVALGREMLAEAFEQLVDQPGLRQRLAK